MILAWGGMIAFLGAVWLVGTIALTLVPIVLLVVLVVVGIGAVGYALTRAEAKKTHPAVA
jgi:ABC-type dipeptide/oligopeptide/nickel transport system permease subunit